MYTKFFSCFSFGKILPIHFIVFYFYAFATAGMIFIKMPIPSRKISLFKNSLLACARWGVLCIAMNPNAGIPTYMRKFIKLNAKSEKLTIFNAMLTNRKNRASVTPVIIKGSTSMPKL